MQMYIKIRIYKPVSIKNINSSRIFFFFQGAQANGVRSLGTNYRQLLVIIVYLAPQRKSHQNFLLLRRQGDLEKR